MFDVNNRFFPNPTDPPWLNFLGHIISAGMRLWALRRIFSFLGAAFAILSSILWVWCWWSDETIGLEKDGHPLRPTMRTVLLSCARGNQKVADIAFTDGMSAMQIEVSMTPWWDNTYLGELYLGGIAFQTLGAGQIHWIAARDTFEVYAGDPELNRYLGLDESRRERLRTNRVSRFQIIRWLQLRGRGSPMMAMLHTMWLRKVLVGRALAQPSEEIRERTRQAYVAAHDRIGNFPLNRNEAEREYARAKLAEALRHRLDDRASIYVLAAYAAGYGQVQEADIQAMVNESILVAGQPAPLAVDGDLGPKSVKAVCNYLSVSKVELDPIGPLHDQVLARWKAETEPRVMAACQQAIASGELDGVEGLLRNRYAGQVSVYNALNSLYVVSCAEYRQATGAEAEAKCLALHDRVVACWQDWVTKRQGSLWDVLLKDEAFRAVFPEETHVSRETLVRHAAHYFLLFRLAPRQFGADVPLQYVPKSRLLGLPLLPTKAEVNVLRWLFILANERPGWLIDPP